MVNYSDCVLRRCRKAYRDGKLYDTVFCSGLTEPLCITAGRCPFYASSENHYRNKKGYVLKKER